ncbi:MAG: ATP synthase F1 subunit delta [Planctomycetota bacterium]
MPLTDTKPDALANLYAKSIYELASEKGGREAVEQVAGELEDLIELAREDARFSEFLSSRVLKRGDRTQSLRTILDGRVHEITLKTLLVLNDNGRLGHLIPIVAALDEIAQRSFGRIEVDLYTADPIDADQLGRIKQQLDGTLGKETVVHPYTDPKMLGGVKLQIGDRLIDASLATQLRRFHDQLTGEGSARLRAAADRAIEADHNA